MRKFADNQERDLFEHFIHCLSFARCSKKSSLVLPRTTRTGWRHPQQCQWKIKNTDDKIFLRNRFISVVLYSIRKSDIVGSKWCYIADVIWLCAKTDDIQELKINHCHEYQVFLWYHRCGCEDHVCHQLICSILWKYSKAYITVKRRKIGSSYQFLYFFLFSYCPFNLSW